MDRAFHFRRSRSSAKAGLLFWNSDIADRVRGVIDPLDPQNGRVHAVPQVKTSFLRPFGLTLLCWAVSICCLAQTAAPTGGIDAARMVAAARKQIGVTVDYDPEYRVMAYPGGDVPMHTGVCTDVVTRALREQGVDLQQAVHEDMKRHFSEYPHQWGLKTPDTNIDHRRVPNLMTYFKRQGWERPITGQGGDYQPGDVVTWNLGGGVTHIGIVSDAQGRTAPTVIHNIGEGTREEDALFSFKLIGHYRLTKTG